MFSFFNMVFCRLTFLQSSIFVVVLLWNPVKSSSGDRSFQFRKCTDKCSKGCDLDEYPGKLPIYLTVFWWDCTDECKYQCMHNVTQSDVKNNKPIKQFYGKVRDFGWALIVIQAPVVRRMDNAIHRINHYSIVCFANTYPLDTDLSSG